MAWQLAAVLLYAQQKYAFTNVSLITMKHDKVLANQTVLVSNGKIERTGNAGKLKLPQGYQVINGAGKYLIPALSDMHVHFFNEQGEYKNTSERELKVMLANGLTTVRIMAGHPNYLQARENVKNNKWLGPDLLIASPQLVGRWPWPPDFRNFEIVDTREKGIAAVKKFKAEGYDAIKITFMVNADVFDAVAQAAKQEGIKLVGHVGPRVKLPAALAAKQQNEHMDEFIDMLLPDTSYNRGQSVSDMNLWQMKAWATVPHLDEKKIPALVDMVKRSGIYVTPTNFFFVSCFGTAYTDEVYKSRPDYKYIPSEIIPERWRVKEMNRNMKIPKESLERYVYLRKKMVHELWKGGVPLMAGSDSPEWFLVPGFSIHDELDMFVQAGLTPFAALQTATVNTAAYLGMNKGTIEPGKVADILLLNQNPLENINNTRSINGVMKNGVWHNREKLDKLLEEGLPEAGAGAQAQVPESIMPVVNAERAFAKASATISTRQAFIDFMDDEGILFKPNAVPGKKFWQDAPEGNDKLTWEPRYADISAAGDLGYTTGPFELRVNRGDEKPAGGGHYLSVWKKQNDKWKVVLDIGIGHPIADFPALTGPTVLSKAVGNNVTSTDELMQTEQSFCTLQNTKGLSAYSQWMGKDIKIFRPMSAPMDTKDAIDAFLSATDKQFSFTPSRAFIASSGDLGYIYGTGAVAIKQGDNTRTLNTNYVRIWKKEDGKSWRIVADLVAVAR